MALHFPRYDFTPHRGSMFLLAAFVAVVGLDLSGALGSESGVVSTFASSMLRLATVVLLVRGYRGFRDGRFLLLAGVFLLAGLRQFLSGMYRTGLEIPGFGALGPEIPGYLVSILGLLAAVHLVEVYRAAREREEFQRRLEVENERYRGMFEDNTAVKLLIDPDDGRIVDANGAAAEFYGWSRDELLRLHIQQVNCLAPAQVEAEMRRARASGQHCFEFRHRRADGSIRDVEVHSSPLRVDGRDLLFSIVFDVTTRNEAEAANRRLIAAFEEQSRMLAAARTDADRANVNKSAFLANMSHEIRTPMTAVLGFAEALEDPELEESERREAVATILDSGNYLLELVNQILDLAKVESGKIEIERHPIDMVAFLRGLRGLLAGRAQDAGLDLDVVSASPVPERLTGDELKIRQILVNLLANAIKFTEDGGVVLRVSFDEATESVVFEVEDTGPGMRPAELECVFEPFEQASSGKKGGGTGLGLPISRRFAEAMGGTLHVDSTPGQGSVFTLTLPVVLEEGGDRLESGWTLDTGPPLVETTDPADRTDPAEPAVADSVEAHVLVADDVVANQMLVRRLLERAGARVVTVSDGQQAIDAVRDAHGRDDGFDVVLMDVQMPRMDGLAATAVLRDEFPALPVLGLTAGVTTAEREALEAAGMREWLSKPLQRAELVERVWSWTTTADASTDTIDSA